ncbi:MAG: GDP-mannose 4,6-dehydratase [bacterium]|nr:GDP-mannose 4,6-dehydratase [bacterium]
MRKKALITGINGQDGSYLAEFLLAKGYEVHGILRRASTFNRWRIDHLHRHALDRHPNLHMAYGDLTDSSNIVRFVKKVEPDEFYNLGAQSHVQVSFETPEYTASVDAIGTLRVIEALRILGLEKKTRFYQASTSELYGNTPSVPQNEDTPFLPRNPYGVAKLYAYWIVETYREAYGMFLVNGVLFNHESPRRGENFVSKKITQSLARYKCGLQDKLVLGHLEAKRDWGYAKEYVEAMWLMLQQKEPEDFVIATGEAHTVREFVEETCRVLEIPLAWQGRGRDEKGVDTKTGKVIVELDDQYVRPTEINILQGDASKAKRVLGWESKVKFKELVKLMAEFDLARYQRGDEKIFID